MTQARGVAGRRCALLLAAIVALPLVAAAASPAVAAGPALDRVEHIVILVNEAQTFDSLLGRYPDVDGIPDGQAPGDLPATAPILASDAAAATIAWNGGAMDGFAEAQEAVGLSGDEAFLVARRPVIPSTWQLADGSVVGDRAFASVLGDGAANRRVLFGYPSGAAAGSILDALDAAGVSWSIAIEGYDAAGGLPEPGPARDRLAALAPPLADETVVGNPDRLDRVIGLEDWYVAVEEDRLPAVSWVLPSGGPSAVGATDSITGAVANSIARNPAWPSTVLVATWDAWGGRADHVAPPLRDGAPIGFRVPLIVRGAPVASGAIDSVERSHESVLRLIEDRFGIAPRTPAETAANSLADLVTEDGSRPPSVVRDDIVRFLPGVPSRRAVLLTYLAVLALFVGMVVVAAVLDRRGRRI